MASKKATFAIASFGDFLRLFGAKDDAISEVKREENRLTSRLRSEADRVSVAVMTWLAETRRLRLWHELPFPGMHEMWDKSGVRVAVRIFRVRPGPSIETLVRLRVMSSLRHAKDADCQQVIVVLPFATNEDFETCWPVITERVNRLLAGARNLEIIGGVVSDGVFRPKSALGGAKFL